MNVKLKIQNLNFFYAKKQVLFSNQLEIFENKVTAIIGPSGSGKSTHLRVYNRIYEIYPDQKAEGRVFFDGEDILLRQQSSIELRRRIGMIFQSPTIFPMTIYNNVAYGLKLHFKMDQDELDMRVEQALKAVFLWEEVKDSLDQSAKKLSQGQQQRLCLARAIALEPEVLLLDEPTASIDPVATGRIEDLIGMLKENYTIVIVTHNLQQASRISDYTAFFSEGKIVEFDETGNLFTRPQDPRTEKFITGRYF